MTKTVHFLKAKIKEEDDVRVFLNFEDEYPLKDVKGHKFNYDDMQSIVSGHCGHLTVNMLMEYIDYIKTLGFSVEMTNKFIGHTLKKFSAHLIEE